MKARKLKKCRECPNEFYPVNSFNVTCGLDCSILFARKATKTATKKQYRKELTAFNKKNVPVKSLNTKAQVAVNSYIRVRDQGKTCISCDNLREFAGLTGQSMEAGHWHGVGAHPSLRFVLWNIRRQCSYCNDRLSGNPQKYRLGLIGRFGLEWVENREHQAANKPPNHYSKETLKRIKTIFTKKTKLYKRLFRD